MSVFSANSFALLGDGDDVAPAPAAAPKAAPAPAAAAPAKPAQQQRNNAQRGPRRPQGDRQVNADVPAGEGAKEDRAKNFARGGGRGGRGGARPTGGNPRGNAGTYLGGNRPRRENGGGRPFDRQSQTGRVDSEKAEAAGWGAEEGKKELEAEQLGDADAKAEAPAEGAATPVREAPIEEEDNTQTYEQYLAAQAEKKLALGSLPEARKANEGEDLFKGSKVVAKKGEEEEEWLMGAPKTASGKAKKQKEAKQFLEVEFRSAPRPRRDDDRRGERSERGGRPARGRGEARGRGGARNGGAPRAPKAAAPAVPDASAFPALA